MRDHGLQCLMAGMPMLCASCVAIVVVAVVVGAGVPQQPAGRGLLGMAVHQDRHASQGGAGKAGQGAGQ